MTEAKILAGFDARHIVAEPSRRHRRPSCIDPIQAGPPMILAAPASLAGPTLVKVLEEDGR